MTEIHSNIYIYACRYGHLRNTGAPLQIVEMVMEAWPNIRDSARSQIVRESHEARYCFGDWERLREFAKEYDDETKKEKGETPRHV